MGSCLCSDESKVLENGFNSEITKHMEQSQTDDKKIHKLLLLGGGNSGKSTILRQMKYLYIKKKGLIEDEISLCSEIMYFNLVQTIRTLIDIRLKLNNKVSNNHSLEAQNKLLSFFSDANLKFQEKEYYIQNYGMNNILINAYKKDDSLKLASNDRECFKQPFLMDNFKYILSLFDEIISNNYKPTFKQIVNCRV